MAPTIKTSLIGIIPSAFFHLAEMMAWQRNLALTWIKCDGSAACE
jgi:hypothetical protein